MKKQIVIPVIALTMCLWACSSKEEPTQTTTTQTTTSQEASSQEPIESSSVKHEESKSQALNGREIKDQLNEIDSWVIKDIWNKGFCDFSHYEYDGKSSTGESIDIDFALEQFKKKYQKKDEYGAFISSLPNEYKEIKDIWKKLIDETERLYEYYQDGIKQGETSADTGKFTQYRDAFSEEVRSIKFTESDAEKPSESSSSSGTIEVDKGMFDVTITVPADYVGETTQEELDERAKEYGCKVKLNEDGSATYNMTKGQHKKMMDNMAGSLREGLDDMVESESYPNFTNIEVNSDFTDFIVTTKSTELSFEESFSVLGLYMYGGIYNAFNGSDVDNIHVEFINADSGEIISSSDSNDQ